MLEKVLLQFLAVVSISTLCPVGLAEEYVSYGNFEFTFEYPVVWSVAEEEGTTMKGNAILEAPALMTNPLEILWDEAHSGIDPESTLNSLIEQFRIENSLSNFQVDDRGTRQIDGNTAFVKELSFDESYISHVAIWAAFVSPKSKRFVLIRYKSFFSFGDENVRGFEHLLDTWHDNLGDTGEATSGGESAPSRTEEEDSAGPEDESSASSSFLISSSLVAEILGSTTGKANETYQNFGFTFDHPSTWSISKEVGVRSKGSITMGAPGTLSTLIISWDEENAGSEEEFANLLAEQLRSSYAITKVDATTRTVDGNTAYVRDLSLDLSGHVFTGRLIAFTSLKSERLIYMNYLTPTSSASGNLADFDHLLDTWRDLG
jgi:hypothetical protein